ERSENRERRRLARPVGPDEPEDRSPGDLEVEVVDGEEVAEALGEALGPDGQIRRHSAAPNVKVESPDNEERSIRSRRYTTPPLTAAAGIGMSDEPPRTIPPGTGAGTAAPGPGPVKTIVVGTGTASEGTSGPGGESGTV